MADKYCKNCGAELPQDSKFCISCGSEVADSDNQKNKIEKNAPPVYNANTRNFEQKPPKRKRPIKVISIVVVGLLVLLVTLFLLLGSCEDTTTPDSNLPDSGISDDSGDNSPVDVGTSSGDSEDTQLDDLLDSSLEKNLDLELLEGNLGSYGTTLVYEGDNYVSVLKLQDHGGNNYTLDIDTPHFVIKLDLITFTEDKIVAIYENDVVEVIYMGNRTSNEEFSNGVIRYTDKETGSILKYDATMYDNYEDFSTLSNTHLGDFDFYYRDYYVLEGSLSQEQEDLVYSVIDKFYSSETSFNITENDDGYRDIIFTQDNNTATYLLNDITDEIFNGYLIESNIKGLQGELLSIHPLSHPDTNIYEGILYWVFDDFNGIVIFFEGFQDKTNSVGNDTDDTSSSIDSNTSITTSNFSGAWENEGDLPIITVIDEGSITMGDMSEYNVSYSNETVTNIQTGILVNNIADLALFKMPYTKNENGLNVSVNIYGGEEFFVDGDFNYYYILDSQGKAYESKGFNQPLNEISELPTEIELVVQLEIDYIFEDTDKMKMDSTITLYEEGTDDLYNPDPYYGDVFDITKTLIRKYED